MLSARRSRVPDETSDSEDNGAGSPVPLAKRAHHSSKSTVGAIRRIYMENFVTYSKVEFHVGPGLNVILGPNGSGKSTVICAICLCLAGKPELLGRATHYKQFIRTNEDRAVIEVELDMGKNAPLTVRRVMTIDRNNNGKASSNFSLNGRPATEEQGLTATSRFCSIKVKQKISALNIQMDNLCQFLPQDKVSEFSRMKPDELLVATETAIGGQKLREKHEKLAEDEQALNQEVNAYEIIHQEYQNGFQRNEQRRPEVEKAQHHRELSQDIFNHENKINFSEYNLLKQQVEALKKECKALEEQSSVARQQVELKEREARESEVIVNKERNKVEAKKSELAATFTKFNEASENLTACSSQLQEVIDEAAAKQKSLKTRQDKRDNLQATLVDLQKELEKASNQSGLQAQLEQVMRELHELKSQVIDLRGEAKQAEQNLRQATQAKQRASAQLERARDQSQRRQNEFFRLYPHLRDAVEWIKQNQSKFKDPIEGPLILALDVSNERAADVIEMTIGKPDQQAFVTTNTHDQQLLLTELRDKKKIPINVLNMDPREARQVDDRRRQQLSGLGFKFMSEHLRAPPATFAFLTTKYHMSEIPVTFDAANDRHVNGLISQGMCTATTARWICPFPQHSYTTLYVDRQNYRHKKSRFNSDYDMTDMIPIRPSTILRLQEDKEAVARLLLFVFVCSFDLVQEAEAMHATKDKDKRALSDKMKVFKTLEADIDAKESWLRSAEKSIRDLQGLLANLKSKAKTYCAQLPGLTAEVASISGTLRTGLCEISQVLMRFQVAHNQHKIIVAQLVECKQNYNTQVQDLPRRKKQIKDMKKEALRLLAVSVRQACVHKETTCLALLFCLAFNTCRSETHSDLHFIRLDRVLILAGSWTQQRNASGEINEAVVREFEQEKIRLDQLKKQTHDISIKFGEFFQQLEGCAGSVKLVKADSYKNWGIQIMVQFRAGEELAPLMHSHQSGGERSVSTMLYLMALQTQTQCPFRVVDEINQGMDDKNERRVFEQVMSVCSQAEASQYFLVTPKLLPNLQYNDKVTVHCVFSGTDMVNFDQWDLGRFCDVKRQLNL
ncbi:uncharacterized protein MONBRDRAFT_28020 [Monosiga brevicollis MX1]|uniref:Structural maintenance of chromosomes protein 5 n=1 Tax=Monosiga brevicollis TaxID=81824 RepID=A9V6Z1_MONBE|nr:uncharacterized protein MONBRDRAFT_28020 [Monosiga brevicollis MX1]EDQ86629.1 predicted protein [Monosiga brevicollis MX1]|eukprot:XP_001748465.1 hypothetical protein [Monosiga brevicollis MX1]